MNVAPDEQERRAKHVPLFRPEAVEYSRMQWLGEFHLSTPIGAKVLTYFLLTTVAMLFVLLFTLQYTRRVEVAGELRADPGIARVAATQSGEVRAVYVVEGEHVHAGQPLFAVGANHVLNDLQDATQAQLASLRATASSLTSQSTVDAAGRDAQLAALTGKRSSIMAQLRSLLRQRGQQVQRVALSRAILDRYKMLHKRGYTSDLSVMLRSDDVDAKQEDLDSLDVSIMQSRAALHDVEAQMDGMAAAFNEKIVEVQQKQSELARQTLQLETQVQAIIDAPVDGTVTGVAISVGEHVESGTPGLSIVPYNSRLVAVLQAPGEAAGLARAGEPVLLRVSAYPYERFGFVRVRVKSISRASVIADPMQEEIRTNHSFLIYAALPSQSITADRVTYQLRPGMSVSGYLLLDRKSLAMWLLGPVERLFSESRR